jgi:hypothetical protein
MAANGGIQEQKPPNHRTAPEVETKKERTKKRNQFLEKASHD